MMNAMEKFNISVMNTREDESEAIFVAVLINLACGDIKLLYCVHHFGLPPVKILILSCEKK